MYRKILLSSFVVVFTGIIGLFVFGLFFASPPQDIPSALSNKKAPHFLLTTFNNEEINFSDFSGKPVILNFWASWCVPCKREAKALEKAHKKFAPRGAVFIGIATNDQINDAINFVRFYGQTFYTGIEAENSDIHLNYGVAGIPETFFIDREGIIREKILGEVHEEQIAKFLKTQGI